MRRQTVLGVPAFSAALDLSFHLRPAAVAVVNPRVILDQTDLSQAANMNPKLNITTGAPSEANTPLAFNDRVLAVVKTMPSGGQYKTSPEAFAALQRAIVTDQSGHLLLLLNEAKPVHAGARIAFRK